MVLEGAVNGTWQKGETVLAVYIPTEQEGTT
jgi:hypothetical protein